MSRQFKFDYDYENDSLFLYNPNKKSKASVEIDDMIIDYDSNNTISAIELLNASIFFNDMGANKGLITKDRLKEISECSIHVIKKNNFHLIRFEFTMKSKEQITAPIMIPTIDKPSPATIA